MIEGLEDFKLDLKHFIEVVVPENHTRLVKNIALKLYKDIQIGTVADAPGTPVDTGWARANWGVHLGREGIPTDPSGEYPGEDKPHSIPLKAYFNADRVLTIKNLGKYPFVWIYNNVHYIEVLEDGHSDQAPIGMVETALNSLQTFVNSPELLK